MEKLRGELMALIGSGFHNANASMARLFRVDFLVGSAHSAGCGHGVAFVSCRFGQVPCFLRQWMTIRRLMKSLFPFPYCLRFSVSHLWPVWDLVFRPSFFVCDFALRFFSAASVSFLSCCFFWDSFLAGPVFASTRNISC